MERIDSIEDQMRGYVTYALSNGDRIRLDARAVEHYGAAEVLRRSGLEHLLPTKRLPVMQHGQRIGTMPADFDPHRVISRNWLYEPRPGDFRREGDAWIASRMLGPGDLEAVPGFRRD